MRVKPQWVKKKIDHNISNLQSIWMLKWLRIKYIFLLFFVKRNYVPLYVFLKMQNLGSR